MHRRPLLSLPSCWFRVLLMYNFIAFLLVSTSSADHSLQGTTNELIYEELGACDDIMYVYIQPNLASLDGNTITVNTTLIDQPCKKYEQQNSFELCGGTDVSVCRDDCSAMCIWTSCVIDVVTPPSKVPVATESFTMCLPRNLTDSEYLQRCSEVLPNQPTLKANRQDNCAAEPIEETSSGMSWIWIVIIIIVLGVGGLSAYYHYSVSIISDDFFRVLTLCVAEKFNYSSIHPTILLSRVSLSET